MVRSSVQPIIVQSTESQGSCRKVIDSLNAKPVVILGVIQIVIGLLCIGVNIAGIIVLANFSTISHGIWCGAFFIITGVFGVAAGACKQLCLIVACAVLSIFATLLCIPMLVIESVSTSTENYNPYVYDYEDTDCCPYDLYDVTTDLPSCCHPGFHSASYLPLRNTVHGLSMFLGVVEGILAIATTTLCCNAVCCRSGQQFILHHGRQGFIIHGAPGYQQGVHPQNFMYNTQAADPQVPVQNYPQYQPPQEPVAPPMYDSEAVVDDSQPPSYESVVESRSI